MLVCGVTIFCVRYPIDIISNKNLAEYFSVISSADICRFEISMIALLFSIKLCYRRLSILFWNYCRVLYFAMLEMNRISEINTKYSVWMYESSVVMVL